MNLNQYTRQICETLSAVRVTDATGLAVDRQDGAQLAVNLIVAARDLGRKVLLVGNGGSAATAAHLCNDLVKAVGVRAMNLHEPSLLTACANDEGYERSFAVAVERWADRDDLLIAISCSGRSENILQAAHAAGERGCRVLTLTGCSPANPLASIGQLNFHVPTQHYGRIEIAHAALAHYLSDAALAALSIQPNIIEHSRRDASLSSIEKNDESPLAPTCDVIARTLEVRKAADGAGHGRGGIRRRRVSA